MTLKGKFIALSTLAIAVIIISAVVGHMSYAKINAGTLASERGAQLMRSHMHADMMHDAVRASVYEALYAAGRKDEKQLAMARADIAAYGEALEKDFTQSAALADDADLRRALGALQGPVADYRQKAQAAAEGGNPDAFVASFKALEDRNDVVAEQVEAYIHAINTAETAITEEVESRSLASALLTVLIALSIPVFAALQVFRPQQKLIGAMQAVSAGNLETPVPYLDRSDEIGAMAKALAVFRQNAADKQRLEQEATAQKKKSEEDRRRAMFGLADNFEANVKSVADTVASAATEMDATSRDVMKRAEDSSELLGRLVTGISGASQNVQTVAAAAAELSASIREISQQVSHGSTIMTAAVTEAKRANETALALTDSAEKIGSVVGVINEIAAQINLLALNATIEAARAGESGKGFAVVASEVKNLAGQTTSATRQIEEQIGLIQQAAGNTASVITQIGSTITEMNRISASIAAAVEEQGMATQEIARNVQQTAEIARGIASNANDVKQSSTGASAAVSQMIAAASDLSRQSESLRGQVSGFLRDIKSG
ncbi:MAG: methyl-accepting chemotaxis protein [Alphaproteobacteria bacterium]